MIGIDDLLKTLFQDVADAGRDTTPGELVRSSLAGHLPSGGPSGGGMSLPMALGGPRGLPRVPGPPPVPGPSVPGVRSAPAGGMPQVAQAPNIPGNALTDFSQGYSSGGLIGAIGNLMQGPETRSAMAQQYQRQQAEAQAQQNMTIKALRDKHPNMPPEMAAVVARNGELLKKYLSPIDQKDALSVRNLELDIAKKEQALKGEGPADSSFFRVADNRLLEITKDGKVIDRTPFDRRDRGTEAQEKEFFTNDIKTVADYRKLADDAQSLTDKLDRLEAARSTTSREGPISAKLPSFSASAQQVDSAATEIQLEFTKQTKGAITEREMDLFKGATPGWQMTDAAAAPVIAGMRVAAERAKEKARFFESWMRAHRSLDGASSAWSRFMKENPIFEKVEGGQLRVNPGNVGNWQPYLRQTQDVEIGQPQIEGTVGASGKSRIIGVE